MPEPEGSFRPINTDFIDGIRIHPDSAHGGAPEHVDVVQRIDLMDGYFKARIDGNGDIIDDQFTFDDGSKV